ncbi:dTMP kinase [Candidatus Mycoplasma haematohominis]|uniref:dTMP kinase n=1 Tax=Candidatus Mycoplasma haematohominis TaxID=1494318 RepID=UPI001C0A6B0B|nr:dTMP kinase [Candidatus Mycoplasma haemohominis]
MNHSEKTPRSLFVVIEGIDFAGKTTLVKMLEESFRKDEKMKELFHEIIYTKEPGTPKLEFCTSIRNLVLQSKEINNETRALLFFANRSEHVEKLIIPTLNKPRRLIICDRFYLSTRIYQGLGNEKLIKWIQDTHKLVCPIVPDLTFMVNISKEIFLSRYKDKLSRSERNYMDTYTYDEIDKIMMLNKELEEEKDPLAGELIYLCGNKGVSPLVEIIKQKIIEKATKNN